MQLRRRLARGGRPALALITMLVPIVLASPSALAAYHSDFLQSGGPPDNRIVMLFWVFVGCGSAVLLLVAVLVGIVCVRFRRRRADEMPKQVHGVARLEVAWTVGPMILLATLFGLTLAQVGYLRHGPPPNSAAGRSAVPIEVIGRQFYWTFVYGNGHESLRTMYIPAGTPVTLATESLDVIHGFWVPQIGAKIDALPGIVNHAFVEASRPGTFNGQCYELCGVGHALMLITVKALPPAQYRATIAKLPPATGLPKLIR